MKLNLLKKSLVIALVGYSANASANLISLFETQRDTDFAYSGTGGQRGTGIGDIILGGVSGTVNQAYLYWHGPTNSDDSAFNSTLNFDGNAITGTNIGFSDDNFWNQLNSQAYRADVTSFVSGDGTYSLDGLSPNNSNGASLVVFFDDGDDTNNRDIVTFDGNDANFPNEFDPDSWDVSLTGIDYTSGDASLVMGVSDGQSFADGDFFINGVNIGAVFNGDTLPNTPGSSVGNGGLWDLLEIDITPFLSPGLNDINLTHNTASDALSAIHFHVNLPAGAAPSDDPTPPSENPIPEPLSVLLLGTGLVLLRRRF